MAEEFKMNRNKQFGIWILLMVLSRICFALEVPVTLGTLSEKSDRIVRGRVMSLAYTQETNRYGDELIYTNVRIRVSESLKGDRSNLIVKVEGGTYKGITLTVSEAAEFQVGQEVLLFVKKDMLDFIPATGSSSKYTISSGGKILENGLQYTAFRTEVLRAVRERSVQR
jgi:hypothetical protein